MGEKEEGAKRKPASSLFAALCSWDQHQADWLRMRKVARRRGREAMGVVGTS